MTDDLISRAEAMTELQMNAERYTVAHEAHGFGTVEWCENLISVSKALEILRNLPTVDAVQHGTIGCQEMNGIVLTEKGKKNDVSFRQKRTC